MNSRFTIVETTLNSAEFRWKWLRIVQGCSVLGGFLALAFLLLGMCLRFDWITDRSTAIALVVCLVFLGVIAGLVILISVGGNNAGRPWLAAAVERVNPHLMDRLNTLLYLEEGKRSVFSQSFSHRIARQLHEVTTRGSSRRPFSPRVALARFAGFMLVLLVAIVFHAVYSPWEHLRAAAKTPAQVAPPAQPENTADLVLPATNSVEQVLPWGEVRITEPGRDLQVTKVDVVPIQIEAAANQRLDSVGWFSTVNGETETEHKLARPSEPRYAVYHPTLFLDELRLADWDVLTYYAKAVTEVQQSYASEVYFLEVRPFREDILKLPGGEGGKAYRTLSEITALIGRQQHIIRQTHQHLQKPPEQENLRDQDRGKLASAEADLGESTQHLYSQMAAEMENQPIGEALDNLAKARDSLYAASRNLETNAMSAAQSRERGALSELVAARKMFQKAISDNPDQFQEPSEEEPTPIADSSQKLSQMAEFRNEAAAARQFMEKTLEQQRALQQKTRSTPRNDYPKLGAEQKKLQQSLQEFQEQHPKPFAQAQQECKSAGNAMSTAATSFQNRTAAAGTAVANATKQLETLKDAMQNRSLEQQMADAYKLREMLDRQAATFQQRSQSNSTVGDAELQRTVEQAGETLNQLKRISEQEPTRDHFGPPLREALSGQNKVDLDAKLKRLERPRRLEDVRDGTSKEERAADAAQALAKVGQAFDESQPGELKLARKQDPLRPSEEGRFNKGMAELESLIAQLENDRQVPAQDRAKMARQALSDLQSGARSDYGDNTDSKIVLARLDELLKGEQKLDVDELKKLFNQLQHLSSETAERLAKAEDQPSVSNIDPTRLPPAYRSRIQKYFQQLSEKQ